jgi:hypothetical protein
VCFADVAAAAAASPRHHCWCCSHLQAVAGWVRGGGGASSSSRVLNGSCIVADFSCCNSCLRTVCTCKLQPVSLYPLLQFPAGIVVTTPPPSRHLT